MSRASVGNELMVSGLEKFAGAVTAAAGNAAWSMVALSGATDLNLPRSCLRRCLVSPGKRPPVADSGPVEVARGRLAQVAHLPVACLRRRSSLVCKPSKRCHGGRLPKSVHRLLKLFF